MGDMGLLVDLTDNGTTGIDAETTEKNSSSIARCWQERWFLLISRPSFKGGSLTWRMCSETVNNTD